MQAVILAGGLGSRLSSLSGGKPKCLIEVGARPLILHQLEALADHGVGPVLCVLGYEAETVRRVIGDRAESLVNTHYAETNSLYSFWLAREWVHESFVLLNCDLMFEPSILELLLDKPGNVLAYDSTSSRGREQTKVAIKDTRVVDVGKDLPGSSARGESLGMLKFEADGARAIVEIADQLIRDGHEKAWVIEALRVLCGRAPLTGVNVAGRPWVEIDFPYDLDVARREVWPAIWKGRWRRQVYWRRTQWAALGAAAFTLALVGWHAHRVGPGSLDWETVPLAGAETVRLERNGKMQRWWSARVGAPATAVVTASKVVAELRLVLPSDSPDRRRYVVAVTVDGRPHDWKAFTAMPDTSVSVVGASVGDKDRLEIPLPPGPHQLGIKLVDGHGRQMLVRIRQPEEP